MTTGRQRGDGGRPSGNSRRASGRNNPIDHGHDQANTVTVVRTSHSDAWTVMKSWPNGAIGAAKACATPLAKNSQPIGLRGR
jgi:hypothetical protein